MDPFAGDPDDPAHELAALDDETAAATPLPVDEHAGVLGDLEDLLLFETLLAPRGVHYFAWNLLRGNMLHLLQGGHIRLREPAFSADPAEYVSWHYARGYADASFAQGEPPE